MSKIDRANVDVEDLDVVDIEGAEVEVEETTKLTVKERINQFKVKHPKLVAATKVSGILTIGAAVGFLFGVGIVSASEAKQWANEPGDNCTPMPSNDDIPETDIDVIVDPIDVSVEI